jgi:hypothetical protein
MLASSAVDCGFEPMSLLSDKHAALRSKSKDWLAENQNNVLEWSDMFNFLMSLLNVMFDITYAYIV